MVLQHSPLGTVADISQEFRSAFRLQASTVALITYWNEVGQASGMTVTSLTSLSSDPPSLLVCLHRETRTFVSVCESGSFGVDLLQLGQKQIAQHCSRPGGSKVLAEEWLAESDGSFSPVLAGSLAHFDCSVVRWHEEFTHGLVVGRIDHVVLGGEGKSPLIYSGGFYNRVASELDELDRQHWQLGIG